MNAFAGVSLVSGEWASEGKVFTLRSTAEGGPLTRSTFSHENFLEPKKQTALPTRIQSNESRHQDEGFPFWGRVGREESQAALAFSLFFL